ncbi:MAG: GGDEF domain-containing protein [Acidiferrobacterales bacterium]
MPAGPSRPDQSELIRKVLVLAHTLQNTRDGKTLCDQLERGSRERAAIHGSVERAFIAFAHTLLHQYIKNPKSDPATRVRAILIQQRIGPYLDSGNASPAPKDSSHGIAGADSPWSTPAFEQHVASVLWSVRHPAQQSPGTDSASGPDRRSTSFAPGNAEAVSGNALEAMHDNIRNLHTALGKDIARALTDTVDFVAHIKTAQLALQHTGNSQDIEVIRKILVENSNELIRGQNSLLQYLRAAEGHLHELQSLNQDLRAENLEPRRIGLTDELTGIPNRTAFLKRLKTETGRAQRHGYPLALAIVDPDRFGDIRAKGGGEAADEVVRCYAREILSTFRAYDMVARYGAGEFALLLPNTGREQAVSALHKAQLRVAGTYYKFSGRRLMVPTFSSGLAWYRSGDTPIALLQRAGRALRRAKSTGTNRIETALPEAVSR